MRDEGYAAPADAGLAEWAPKGERGVPVVFGLLLPAMLRRRSGGKTGINTPPTAAVSQSNPALQIEGAVLVDEVRDQDRDAAVEVGAFEEREAVGARDIVRAALNSEAVHRGRATVGKRGRRPVRVQRADHLPV